MANGNFRPNSLDPQQHLTTGTRHRTGSVRLLERPRDSRTSLFHEPADEIRQFVWQKVGDPDEATPSGSVEKHLERGIVMGQLSLDDRIREPAPPFVDVDDLLADDHAVRKCDEA